jgi:UDP-N-acetyl-D-mannosaminuronic acid dehydrogenase
MLLAVSRVNESVPLFLLEGAKRRLGGLSGRKVAVLGLAFKADTDDERDSLSHKLIRLLERELADVAVHDPHVESATVSLEEALQGADAVFVATNHSETRHEEVLREIAALCGGDCLVIDPWDCWGAQTVFACASELLGTALAA